MFNKEESNKIRKVEIKNPKNLKKIGYLLLTPSFSLSTSNVKKEDPFMENHFKHEKKIIEYLSRVKKYSKTKEYDKKIVSLYKNGGIIVDKKRYPIEMFYITYTSGLREGFHLICIGNDDTDILLGSREKYPYDNIVKLVDTTAFIDLIKSEYVKIIDTSIEIIDKNKIKETIDKWDGYIHDKVPETDAVDNKDRLGI